MLRMLSRSRNMSISIGLLGKNAPSHCSKKVASLDS
jgi:hypothetical protein